MPFLLIVDLSKSYKLQGYKNFQGLDISIENRKGSVRSGVDKDGHEWSTKMKHAYGYIKGIKRQGSDKEHVDCFVGPDEKSEKVFIVHLNRADTGKFDEDKVFLGFNSTGDVKAAFNANYDKVGQKLFGGITEMDMSNFKQRLSVQSNGMIKSLAMPKPDSRPDSDYNTEQLEMGIRVESEHTDDPEIAKKIAKDHLDEIPDYYDRLEKMEDEAMEKGWPEMDIEKGHVKAHFRLDPRTGKRVFIKDFDNNKHKHLVHASFHAGDTVKVTNPKSKHFGKEFTVKSYNDKYNTIYVAIPGQKHTGDFRPEHLENISRKSEAEPAPKDDKPQNIIISGAQLAKPKDVSKKVKEKKVVSHHEKINHYSNMVSWFELGKRVNLLTSSMKPKPNELKGAAEILGVSKVDAQRALAFFIDGDEEVVKKRRAPEHKEMPDQKDLKRKSDGSFGLKSPEKTGKSGSAYTSKNTKIDFEYKIVDMSDIKTSHDTDFHTNPEYPQEIQPRSRDRKAMRLQVQAMAKQLIPEKLGQSNSVGSGAPIVGPDFAVESGNGRTIAINMAYQNQQADNYKAWLVEKADEFGMSPDDIKKIKQPVLVRVRKTDIDRVKFAKEANQDEVAKMSPYEQAVSDAENISNEDLEFFRPSEDGSIAEGANREFISRFLAKLGTNESAGYLTSDGKLTRQGIDRIQAAVFAKAYKDEGIITLQAEEANPDIKNIINALTMSAGEFARASAIDGYEKLDLGKPLIEGIKLIRKSRNEKVSIDQVLDQKGLFESHSPEGEMFARFIDQTIRSGKKMGLVFKHMGVILKNHLLNKDQMTMFGDPNKTLTKQEIIKEGIEHGKKAEEDKQGTLFSKALRGKYQESKRRRPERTGENAGGQIAYVVSFENLNKSNVKAHFRVDKKTGKKIFVKDYSDARNKHVQPQQQLSMFGDNKPVQLKVELKGGDKVEEKQTQDKADDTKKEPVKKVKPKATKTKSTATNNDSYQNHVKGIYADAVLQYRKKVKDEVIKNFSFTVQDKRGGITILSRDPASSRFTIVENHGNDTANMKLLSIDDNIDVAVDKMPVSLLSDRPDIPEDLLKSKAGKYHHVYEMTQGLDTTGIGNVVEIEAVGDAKRLVCGRALSSGDIAQKGLLPLGYRRIDLKNNLTDPRDRKIYDIENNIRHMAKEEVHILHYDQVRLSKAGARDNVQFDRDDLVEIFGKTLLHNHPTGTSFSPEDIMLAHTAKLSEIRATGSEYTYSMKPPDGGWKGAYKTGYGHPEQQESFLEVFNRIKGKKYYEIMDRIDNGSISVRDANLALHHEVLIEVAKICGLKYERKKNE